MKRIFKFGTVGALVVFTGGYAIGQQVKPETEDYASQIFHSHSRIRLGELQEGAIQSSDLYRKGVGDEAFARAMVADTLRSNANGNKDATVQLQGFQATQNQKIIEQNAAILAELKKLNAAKPTMSKPIAAKK